MKSPSRLKLLPLLLSSLIVSPNLLAAESIKEAFTNSSFSGNWRTIQMKTENKDPWQDWDALATGIKLKAVTDSWQNFRLGIAGYATVDLNSNRTVVDPITGRTSRYEAGLFDLEDINDDSVLLLGELYLNWRDKNHQLDLGRMKLKTPMMNAFDGRMIPTLFEAAWYKNNAITDWKLQLGVVTGIAVRGTSEFKDLDQAIGVLSQAKAPSSANSNYKGNLDSDYVMVANANYTGIKGAKLNIWNYYWDNVMNTAYLEGHYNIKSDKLTYTVSGQYINQSIVGDGGNKQEELSFVEDNFNANVFGLKMAVKGYGAMLSLAAVEITDDGRFTKPREWGKDPLFTFQRRELGDGFGDSSAWLVRLKYDLSNIGLKGLTLVTDHGKHDRPALVGPDKFKFNKYAYPSFSQTNVNIIYQPKHLVKGLKVELLYVHKVDDDDTNKAAFQQNKAETEHYSFVVNYSF